MTVIEHVQVTPVAFADPPLLNAVGVHEPYALRAVIEVETADGVSGLGETYADAGHLAHVTKAAQDIVGLDVYALNAMRARIEHGLGGRSAATRTDLPAM